MFSHDVEGWHTEKEPKQPKIAPPRENSAQQTAGPDTERERAQQNDDKGKK